MGYRLGCDWFREGKRVGQFVIEIVGVEDVVCQVAVEFVFAPELLQNKVKLLACVAEASHINDAPDAEVEVAEVAALNRIETYSCGFQQGLDFLQNF
jgi:hypothetical protein